MHKNVYKNLQFQEVYKIYPQKNYIVLAKFKIYNITVGLKCCDQVYNLMLFIIKCYHISVKNTIKHSLCGKRNLLIGTIQLSLMGNTINTDRSALDGYTEKNQRFNE